MRHIIRTAEGIETVPYSRLEVANALQKFASVECEGIDGEEVRYFLHVDDSGEIVPHMSDKESAWFSASADYDLSQIETIEDIYEMEELDNTEFMAVVDNLTGQANGWLDQIAQNR